MATVLGNDPNALDYHYTKGKLAETEKELIQMFELNKRLVENLNGALEEFKKLHALHSKAVKRLKDIGELADDVEYVVNKPNEVDAYNFMLPNQF